MTQYKTIKCDNPQERMVAMAFLEVEKPSKGRRDGCGMGEENVTGENYNQELIEVKEVQ